jgi:hypothetical protein
MTSLQRAAAYLKKVGPKAVLAIVPLAAAIPAHAGVVFNYSSGAWDQNALGQSPFTGANSISGTPLSGSLIQGVSLGGAYNLFASGGTIVLTASWFGDGTGSTIPFPSNSVTGFWNFNVTMSGAEQTIWDVTYNINGSPITADSGSFNGSGGINSGGSLPVTSGANLTSWSTVLTLSWSGFVSPMDVTVNGIGIQAEDVADVPEPSTFLLMTPLAGLLIVRVRRRKR